MSEEIVKERNTENIDISEERSLKFNPFQGLNGTSMVESGRKYLTLASEKVFSSSTNAHVILGKDSDSIFHGYNRGGQIKLVAGLGATNKSILLSSFIPTRSNVVQDAATVLISQKSDIDKKWKIPDGFVGSTGKRSSVGLKADNIRIVAREGIKISTLPPGEERNSLFGKIKTIKGIDLLAGISEGTFKYKTKADGFWKPSKKLNYLQPIVKGDNLDDFLNRLLEEIILLTGNLKDFYTKQSLFNESVVNHSHIVKDGLVISPQGAVTGIVKSPQPLRAPGTLIKQNIIKHKRKIESFQGNLNDFQDTFLGDNDKETNIKSKSVRST